jgi:hypothetical protein
MLLFLVRLAFLLLYFFDNVYRLLGSIVNKQAKVKHVHHFRASFACAGFETSVGLIKKCRSGVISLSAQRNTIANSCATDDWFRVVVYSSQQLFESSRGVSCHAMHMLRLLIGVER